MDMPLEALPNLGPASGAWLPWAGFATHRDLARAGPVEAYLAVCQSGRKASLNLLYAVAGAIEGVHWQAVARSRLLMELDQRRRLPLLD